MIGKSLCREAKEKSSFPFMEFNLINSTTAWRTCECLDIPSKLTIDRYWRVMTCGNCSHAWKRTYAAFLRYFSAARLETWTCLTIFLHRLVTWWMRNREEQFKKLPETRGSTKLSYYELLCVCMISLLWYLLFPKAKTNTEHEVDWFTFMHVLAKSLAICS